MERTTTTTERSTPERRRTAQVAAAALALCLFAWALQTPARAPDPLLQGIAVASIAHRGASAHAPENTIPAFRRALELGADVIEMDVRLSADGHVVVIHDATVDRTTDGTGRVAELTLAELRTLDAGHAYAGAGGEGPYRGVGTRIPTLAEVLAAFPEARLMVELKAGAGAALVDSAAAVLQRSGAEDRVIVASFDSAYLRRFRRLLPGAATAAGSSETARLYLLHRVGLHRWYRPAAGYLTVPEEMRGIRIVTPRFLRAAERLGMEVHVWTVNDPGDMRRLVGMGVDGILTDHPDRLRSVTPPPPPPSP
jgi:glycerophosphoryl diester phosphodiesterase